MQKELQTDVLIAGGGIGGCAAALAVARAGYRAVLTEETDWIGGQFTAQAVPPDEHGWIERFGCTAAYRSFRNGVRQYYRDQYPLTDTAREQKFLNPGGGWVSPLCHEPRVALAVLEGMLAPYVSSGHLRILREHRPVAAVARSGDRVSAVTFRNIRGGDEQTISASYVLDATELGELLPLAGVEFVTGSESQEQTGEPSAAAIANPHNNQAMSVCFSVDHLEGQDHTIPRPAEYEYWRDFVPRLDPPWPGKLLDWNGPHPRTLKPLRYHFDPHREPSRAFSGLWSYRRILARENFLPGAFASDICTINWPMIDYLGGDLLSGSEEDKDRHIAAAKQLSLSLFYWLQTEVPRPDGSQGFPGLRLRGDVVGSEDGLAKYPYIRESRRIEAEFTVREQHVSAALRPDCVTAQPFDDSVGIGYYRIDLHPTTGGDNYLDVEALPFQIPLGALIPVRVENLLPAAKNIGTTHITNGCYRLHPVEWNIGEAAGSLACFCIQHGRAPREVYRSEKLRKEYQNSLLRQGVELAWPQNIKLEDGEPHAHAM
ncbi:MAG: FAD-dependent oxidoreductase [Planctomycetota bacterium]|nr:FAD-dependent oxidoreductase [Planctomycetota bacterium]